jgi:hypothetical protein
MAISTDDGVQRGLVKDELIDTQNNSLGIDFVREGKHCY